MASFTMAAMRMIGRSSSLTGNSTSLMANGGAFEDAVARVRQAPRLGIGAHLNLTQGPTVTRATLVRSLVQRNGEMSIGPIGLGKKIATGKVRLDEVELELRAQIEKILGVGIKLTHLDGHKHIQLLPGVFDIVLKLAGEYGIKGIRCAVEPSNALAVLKHARRNGKGGIKQYGLGRALSFFALRSRGKAKRAGLLTPRYFLGIAQTGTVSGTSRVCQRASNLRKSSRTVSLAAWSASISFSRRAMSIARV